MHDAGGAEDREAADDAEPGVGGPARQDLAARDRDRHLEIAGIALIARDRLDQPADQPARRRVDRGLADRHRQAGPGHHADPLAGDEHDAAARLAAADASPGSGRRG